MKIRHLLLWIAIEILWILILFLASDKYGIRSWQGIISLAILATIFHFEGRATERAKRGK